MRRPSRLPCPSRPRPVHALENESWSLLRELRLPDPWRLGQPFVDESALPPGSVVVSTRLERPADFDRLRAWSARQPLVPFLAVVENLPAFARDVEVHGLPLHGWCRLTTAEELPATLASLNARPPPIRGLGAHHLDVSFRSGESVSARLLAVLLGSAGPPPALADACRVLAVAADAACHALARDVGRRYGRLRDLCILVDLTNEIVVHGSSLTEASAQLDVAQRTAQRIAATAGGAVALRRSWRRPEDLRAELRGAFARRRAWPRSAD